MPRLSQTPDRLTPCAFAAGASKSKDTNTHRQNVFIYWPALYVLLKPFRSFVTVNVPSGCAETLNQCAAPLCTGAGAAPGPGAGACIGATGNEVCGSSTELAMNIPGTVYSWPLSCEKCICQRSSRPGAE